MQSLHNYTCIVFFFTATATPETYTLSLHDALPIFAVGVQLQHVHVLGDGDGHGLLRDERALAVLLQDRKSTRLNSSHRCISYAVFCLKKKKKKNKLTELPMHFHP